MFTHIFWEEKLCPHDFTNQDDLDGSQQIPIHLRALMIKTCLENIGIRTIFLGNG